MTVISLEQGSESWKQWRMSRVTATDIPIVLGSSPWKSKLELWEEKLGLRPPPELNEAMLRGMRLELPARELASIQLGIAFNPAVYASNLFPWLAASLDGISECGKSILEIKCPKYETHLEAAIENIIPEYYADQIQCQLLVTQADIAYYYSYRPEYTEEPYAIIEVYPNLEKQAEIIAKGQEFYINMCTMNPPEDWKLKGRK